jgi:hypothetical protein
MQPLTLEASTSANCSADITVRDCELPTQAALSVIGDNIAGYIAGYIGRQLLKQLRCADCKEALVAEHQSVRLAQIKDRGGLLAPSADLRSCVNVCEQHRRAVSSLFTSRAVDQLLAKSLTDVVSRGLFANLPCDQAADENHRYFLLQKICQKYLFIRLAHSARTINLAAKSSVRQQLSKKIIFLGQ